MISDYYEAMAVVELGEGEIESGVANLRKAVDNWATIWGHAHPIVLRKRTELATRLEEVGWREESVREFGECKKGYENGGLTDCQEYERAL